MTNGAAHVRCELDVIDGDYVISNSYGVATKSSSNRGYKVVALHNINGVPHATIQLNISADQVDSMGAELQSLDSRMDAAETNIVSAINVANAAYRQSTEAAVSSSVSKEAIKEALESILNSEHKIEEFEQVVGSANTIATQARAIAESAVTSAISIRDEAVEKANEAWSDVNNLTKTLEPIITWEDSATGIKGADYLVMQMNNGIATSYDVKAVEDELEIAQSAIIRNGKELQSLMTVIDKYSVGPYSQAYGFTLDQVTSVLKEGMMYVPTTYHTETYANDDEAPTSPRTFIPWYLYQWGKIGEHYGWITVDKKNRPIDYDETTEENKTNTAGRAVYFASQMIPDVVGNPQYGYWYTDGDTSTGGAKDYESYTLYKWEQPENGDGYWVAVATLAGNSSNRAVSQIRQDANSIAIEVTNARGSAASLTERITDTESDIQSLALWSKGGDEDGEQYNLATIKQTADDAGADIALVVQEVDGEKVVNAASIIAAINGDGSSVGINADRIVMTGTTTFLQPSDVGAGGSTQISGARIITGTLDANRIATNTLRSKNYDVGTAANAATPMTPASGYSQSGTFFDLYNGAIHAPKFYLDANGKIHANEGDIGGWIISSDGMSKGQTLINSDDEIVGDSLVTHNGESAVRMKVGDNVARYEVYSENDEHHWYGTLSDSVDLTQECDGGELLSVVVTRLRAVWDGTYEAEESSYSTTVDHANNSFTINVTSDISLGNPPDFYAEYTYTYQKPVLMQKTAFMLLDDGSLYANAAHIEGTLQTGTATTFTRIQDGEVSNASINFDSMLYAGVGYNVATFTSGELEFQRTNTSIVSDGSGHIESELYWSTANELVDGNGVYHCPFVIYAQDGVISGSWQSDSAIRVTSWRGAKNSIEDLPDKYSVMFDNLRPVRHKYNDGQSDRYHTSLILDELKDAMDIAGVDSSELAAYCVYNEETGEGGIRYSELVALNISEIQKLKARIIELETKLDALIAD